MVKRYKVTTVRPMEPDRRMEIVAPVIRTRLTKRMVEGLGPEAVSLLQSFKINFNADLVWYVDQEGEVGKKPGWVDEPR